MQKHTTIYFQYFSYDESDFVPSELSGKRATEIHHIENKGMGSSEDKDYIENLMALTREEHLFYGDKVQYMDFLKQKHKEFMNEYSNEFKKITERWRKKSGKILGGMVIGIK